MSEKIFFFNICYKNLQSNWNIFFLSVILLGRRGGILMGFQQDTVIYIDNQDKLDASDAANSFADKNVKNRA